MAEKTYQGGEVIFREGDEGNTFYQILNGSVEVVIGLGTENETKLTDLETGEFFGEIAVLEGFQRTATVIATEKDTRLLELSDENMTDSFENNPELVLSLMELLGRRIKELSEDCDEVQDALERLKAEKDGPVDPAIMAKASRMVSCFFGKKSTRPSVESVRNTQVKDGFSEKVASFDSGTVLFREGEPGDCMYAVHSGCVGIFYGYGTQNEKLLTTLKSNSFFGEMAMLYKEPHSATAVILDSGTILEIIRQEDVWELFEKNKTKVWMIMDHLARRLRDMTKEYAEACQELCRMK